MHSYFQKDVFHASPAEVNLRRLSDRHAWADVFGVSVGELIAAIETVGSDAERIFLYLRNKTRDFAAGGTGSRLSSSV
jgi:hypothetical protein